MTPTCDPKPGEHEPLAHQGKYVTPMCLGIFWSVEEWLEMASKETVMLILRSSPNLADILGDTYFDLYNFLFVGTLLLPDLGIRSQNRQVCKSV